MKRLVVIVTVVIFGCDPIDNKLVLANQSDETIYFAWSPADLDMWYKTTNNGEVIVGMIIHQRRRKFMQYFFVISTLLFVSVSETLLAQRLMSSAHGIDLIIKDIPKEQLIDEIRFSDGKDDTVGVVLDYVGPPLGPLIISSKLPIMTDSLGIRPVRFPVDTMAKFIQTIHLAGPKMHDRKKDKILVRVVYRYHQKTYLYYETNLTLVTAYFMLLEKRFVANDDKQALLEFYDFLAQMGLLHKGKDGKPVWTVFHRER